MRLGREWYAQGVGERISEEFLYKFIHLRSTLICVPDRNRVHFARRYVLIALKLNKTLGKSLLRNDVITHLWIIEFDFDLMFLDKWIVKCIIALLALSDS